MNKLVDKLSILLKEKGKMLCTAESCTGGLIAKLMTDRAGSSSVFERGFVTYSNDSKRELLEVAAETLKAHGAVSKPTALEMAKGALSRSNADIAVSCTGVAGPGGGSDEKPVGLVYIGWADKDGAESKEYHFAGSRENIRQETAKAALSLALERLNGTI